jgi:hypothetical protein
MPTTGKPEGVTIADVDGDGRVELVAATREPGALLVWKSACAPPRSIPLPDYPLGPLLVRRGERALVAVAPRESREILLLDLAETEPLAAAEHIALSGVPRVLARGRESDGATGLAIATREGRLHLHDARGEVEIELVDAQPTFVAVRPEGVLVGSQAGQSVRAYRFDAAGTPVPAGEPILLGGIPRAYLFADADLVAGGDGSLWKISDPFGEPKVERLSAALGAIPLDLESVGNGTPGSFLSLAFRDLSYSLWSQGALLHREYAGQDPWNAATGDLDGDGHADLAFALRDAQRIAVVGGRDRASFAEALRIPVDPAPHSLAVADLDGDGAGEILVLCALPETLCVLTRTKDGWTRSATLAAGLSADCVRAADLDGDGRPDVAFLVRGESGSRLVVLFGAAGAPLDERTARAELVLGGSASDLLLADLDGDGRAEILAADPERGRLVLARAGGTRKLEPGGSFDLPTAPRAFTLLTSAETGEPSIAVVLGEPGPRTGLALVSLSIEGGRASLEERAFYPVEGALPIDVTVARDARARPRIAVLSKASAGDGPGRIDTFVLAPDSTCTPTERLPTGLRPFAVGAGDLDGDGVDDLVVSAQNSHHLNAWLQTSAGLQRLPDLGAGRGVLDVLCVDLDGDGKLEIVSANGFSNDVSVISRW